MNTDDTDESAEHPEHPADDYFHPLWDNTKREFRKPKFYVEILAIIGLFAYTTVTALMYSTNKQSNETTREALTSVQRAFVSFLGSAYISKTVVAGKTTELVFNLPWENSGVTPTKNADSRVNWKVFTDDLPANFTFADQGNVQHRQFEIPPKGVANTTLPVQVVFVDAARKGGPHLFVWGWITYNDIFDNTPRRLSEFCDEIINIKSTPEDIADPAATITLELQLCQVHNCSDERCADYNELIKKQ
jgi:hypothetical protein